MSAEEFQIERPVLRPTARAWILHSLSLLTTLVTATIAGVLYPFGTIESMPVSDPQSWPELFDFITTIPERYVGLIASVVKTFLTEPSYLIDGLSFSLSLLFILICHEMGHYIACRIYRVDATLPFFIPTPPMIGPAGTFGAFIKIMSPMPSRKAVFDIGVAGPIAGFLALIPIAIIGLLTMQTVTPEQAANLSGGIAFADPLLVQILAAA